MNITVNKKVYIYHNKLFEIKVTLSEIFYIKTISCRSLAQLLLKFRKKQ